MTKVLYFVFLYICTSTECIRGQSRDELIDRLLQETMELRNENAKVWERIKKLEAEKDMTENKSKRCK